MKSKNNLNIVYETDASQLKGKAENVVFPKSISELTNLVRLSKKITIRGGGTGLVGGAVPQNDLVLDLSKLNHILDFDKQRKTVEVEAGVILDDLNDFLSSKGFIFPVNPSSHAVCTLGGMIATDAVGSRATKYGKTSKWVNWIEIVDSFGNVKRKTSTELSDYAGMEGITGIIVKASLKLTHDKKRTAELISKDNLNEIIGITRVLKRNPDVSMIEFLDKQVSEMLGLGDKYHLIVEYESNGGQLKEKEYEKIMETRDKIYPLLSKQGFTKIEDPRILLDRFEKLQIWLESKSIPVFGHLAVGIVHPCFSEEHISENLISEMVSNVRKLHGQISGEHGIGLSKRQYVDPNDKKILLNVKKRTDPENKFNQGKVI